MRFTLLLAAILATTLPLAACGKNSQSGAEQNAGDNLTAESIVSNDVTAIDAVTGDAANMAADVDMNYGDLGNEGGDEQAAEPGKPAAREKSAPAAAKATENSTSAAPSNTTTNAE